VEDYLITVLTGVALFGIQALALNIQWGWAGILNLSFVGWVALGAYVSAFVTTAPGGSIQDQHWLGLQQSFFLGAIAAMVVCGVVSLLLGYLALKRLRSDYFAIVTLGIYTIFFQFVGNYQPFANGFNGMFFIPSPFAGAFGLQVGDNTYNLVFLGFVLILLAGVLLFCHLLQRSPFGRTLRAVRDDQTAALAFGRSILWFKLRAFVLGSVIAGLGGALTAHWVGTYGPASWTTQETLVLLVCVMLGGTANNWGVVIGAVLVNGLFTEITALVPNMPGPPGALQELRLVFIGLLVLAVILWRPRGILGEPVGRDHAPEPARLAA
jgi:branched-chain amino acid transport system permease protein